MDANLLNKEITFRTSRSSGPGGQNVNKVETKVEALFDITTSEALTEHEKHILLERLFNQINSESVLTAVDQTSRSQLKNKALAMNKLVSMITKALTPAVKRKPTVVPVGVKNAIRRAKKHQAIKKANRSKPSIDEDSEY